jgi:hypothetical protein
MLSAQRVPQCGDVGYRRAMDDRAETLKCFTSSGAAKGAVARCEQGAL